MTKTVTKKSIATPVLLVITLFMLPAGSSPAQDADTPPPRPAGSGPAQQDEAAQPQPDDAANANRTEQTARTGEAGSPGQRINPVAAEEIVVTGSRIRRDAFTAALPVTVISEESSTLAGLADISDILQSSALASGTQVDNSYGGLVVSGGPGVNSFGLRSLDPGRTLVLVNGRRFTPAGTRGEVNSVDLNSIPYVAIDRIEILKDGASSIYGADAVAGVVNIITKKRFDGFSVKGYYQDELDLGSISGLYGKTWDRGYIDVGVRVSSLGPVGRDEQDYSFCDERPLTNGGVQPGQLFAPTRGGRCFGLVNGYVNIFTSANRYSVVQDAESDLFGTGLPWRRAGTGETGYRDERSWDEEHLIPERRRIQVYSDGLLDLDLGGRLGTVSASYEFYYSRRDDSRHDNYRQFFPYVHSSNPTNPFGAYGVTAQPVVMSYTMLDPVNEVKNDVSAVRLGLEGGLGGFTWKLDGGYSWSRGEWTYDTWLKDKVARALSAAPGPDGTLECVLDGNQLLAAAGYDGAVRDRILAEGPDPDCVPLDLFSEDALARGEIPAQAAEYVSDRVTLETDYDLWNAGFYLEGSVFDMPAGAARAVAGFDWRHRSLHDRPPPAAVEDNQWRSTAAGITRGDDHVIEGYTEVEVPLLAGFKAGNVSLAEELTVNGSYRYTHYSSYGSDSTWRLLFNYAVNPVVRVRSTLGTSFRAPALYHLNLADQTVFTPQGIDPCSDFRDPLYGPGSGSNAFRNCTALEQQGIIPANFRQSSRITEIRGGNPGLKAETSDSWTLGFVLTPDLAGRFPALGLDLSLAFDYYNIDISNSIARLSARTILNRCYNSPSLAADECSLVGERRDDGQISQVDASYINIAVENSSGYDITVRAEREFPFGNLSVDILAARLLSIETGLQGFRPTDRAGWHGQAKWRGESDVRFYWRDVTLGWSTDYIGSTSETPIYALPNDAGVTNVTRAGARVFHNLSFRYRDPKRRYSLVAGVRNVFDETPPVLGWGSQTPSRSANVYYNIPLGAGYSLLDRRFFATFSYNFSSLF